MVKVGAAGIDPVRGGGAPVLPLRALAAGRQVDPVSDNRWIRLSGDADIGGGLNMALVEEIETDHGTVVLTWFSGRRSILSGDEAARLIVWLREQPVPTLRPGQ